MLSYDDPVTPSMIALFKLPGMKSLGSIHMPLMKKAHRHGFNVTSVSVETKEEVEDLVAFDGLTHVDLWEEELFGDVADVVGSKIKSLRVNYNEVAPTEQCCKFTCLEELAFVCTEWNPMPLICNFPSITSLTLHLACSEDWEDGGFNASSLSLLSDALPNLRDLTLWELRDWPVVKDLISTPSIFPSLYCLVLYTTFDTHPEDIWSLLDQHRPGLVLKFK